MNPLFGDLARLSSRLARAQSIDRSALAAHTCACWTVRLHRTRSGAASAHHRDPTERLHSSTFPSTSSSTSIQARSDLTGARSTSNTVWSAPCGAQRRSAALSRPEIRPTANSSSKVHATSGLLNSIAERDSVLQLTTRRNLSSSAPAKAKVSKSIPSAKSQKKKSSEKADFDSGGASESTAPDGTKPAKSAVSQPPLRPGSIKYQEAFQAVKKQKRERGEVEETEKEKPEGNFDWVHEIMKKQKVLRKRKYDDWGGGSELSPQLARSRRDAAWEEISKEHKRRLEIQQKAFGEVVEQIAYDYPHIVDELDRGDIKLDDFEDTLQLAEHAEKGPFLAKGRFITAKGLSWTFAWNFTHSFFFKYKSMLVWLLFAIWIGVFRMWRRAYEDWSERKDPRRLLWMNSNICCSMENLRNGKYWTLVTAMFSHSDLQHAFGNFVLLFIFGRPLVRLLGPVGWLGLYLTSGIVATGGAVVWDEYVDPMLAEVCSWRNADEERRSARPLHGASGAIYGVATVSYFPSQQGIVLFPRHIALPITNRLVLTAMLLGAGYGVLFGDSGKESHASHLFGALAGFLWLRMGMSSKIKWASKIPLPKKY
ncbi:rhomboid-domain-containing protein [Ceraceosorus guamensis]|uniref:Rhomboid-domain-containing protein n=1 Tax=Ceraceosorus guamensis TaxID=1522189 RepID=A0A316W2B7_9BASI|nr:rhomboid-domain-containing protein [Ceraceosorus guamensis]PWN43900.1 rhomboid-domain-containing protein [Ceraceosorus guamensis]